RVLRENRGNGPVESVMVRGKGDIAGLRRNLVAEKPSSRGRTENRRRRLRRPGPIGVPAPYFLGWVNRYGQKTDRLIRRHRPGKVAFLPTSGTYRAPTW